MTQTPIPADQPVELIIILDRSGSMAHIWGDTMGGLSSFVDEYREAAPHANLTICLFNEHATFPLVSRQLSLVGKIEAGGEYRAMGNTALYDAMCKTIDDAGRRFAQYPEHVRQKLRVVCLTITDGIENASYQYDKYAVRSRIAHQEASYSWQFQFLGANINAQVAAGDIGISPLRAANFAASGQGAAGVFRTSSEKMRTYGLCGASGGMDYTPEERKDLMAGEQPK